MQPSFDHNFETWSPKQAAAFNTFLCDPNSIALVQMEMKIIRKHIRTLLRTAAIPDPTPTIFTVQEIIDDNMANIKQSVAQFEQRLDSALQSMSTLVATMPATIEKQVSRAMSKHMSPRVIDQDLRQVLTPPDPDAIIEGGGNIQFNNDDQDGIITDPLNPPHINELLPKTKVLLRPNRRSSFYVGKGRKAVAKALKSPLERSFEVGCNDDMLYTTSSVPGSLTST